MTLAVAVLALLLAAANGGNDVAKGIATLAGSGVASYRTALFWGAVTTLAGALASAWLATGLGNLFAEGIVDTSASPAFALAVLLGAAGWVAVATVWRLPVSTTHALVGALIGAGLVLGSESVHWEAVSGRVLRPLLTSAAIAFTLTALIVSAIRVARLSGRWLVGDRARLGGATTSGATARAEPPSAGTAAFRSLAMLHWLSSGAVGAARGLNDTPKLAAVAGVVLVPAGMSTAAVALLTAVAMFLGALATGAPVARRLGDEIVEIAPAEGLGANAVTAVLVGFGAQHGLPMSTTHVSTGAIAGLSGGRPYRLNQRALREFALAWTATPLVAGLLAGGTLTAIG